MIKESTIGEVEVAGLRELTTTYSSRITVAAPRISFHFISRSSVAWSRSFALLPEWEHGKQKRKSVDELRGIETRGKPSVKEVI